MTQEMAEERVPPSREDWLKNGQERINGGVIMARNSKWSEDMLLGGSLAMQWRKLSSENISKASGSF